ncbi:MAG: cell envelope integrity protein TolA [Nitrosomonadales bacterium]|nr:cell envelope integrity protein TolA [Nitrosomonadales bacterium]
MSALAYSYSESYRLPAGALALGVHLMFFALLYFGVTWRTEPPQGMVVDIWQSLPEPQPAPVSIAPPPVEPPKPIEQLKPVEPPKADIELTEKNKPKIKPVEIRKPVEIKPVQPKQVEPVQVDQKALAQQAAQAEQARARAAQQAAAAAAITSEIGKYTGLIRAKIKRNIVMPADVQDSMQVEFDVTLLPGGSVLSARRTRSSGSTAYDEAVERAIMKAQPLPLPQDVSLFKYFRELHLTFTPKEE